MRVLPVLLLTAALACGCATVPATSSVTQHTLFNKVELSVPSSLRPTPAQGVDSEVAHFKRPGLHLNVAYGAEVAQVQSTALDRGSFTLASGQVFDTARVADGMEGYAHGIWMVQRVATQPSSSTVSNDRRVGVYVNCVDWKDCEEVARLVRTTMRVR